IEQARTHKHRTRQFPRPSPPMNPEDTSGFWPGERGDRPWGFHLVLYEEKGWKAKRFLGRPGKRMSLQRPRHRAEHWHLVAGEALVNRDGEEIRMEAGHSLDIPQGAVQRLANAGRGGAVGIRGPTGACLGA